MWLAAISQSKQCASDLLIRRFMCQMHSNPIEKVSENYTQWKLPYACFTIIIYDSKMFQSIMKIKTLFLSEIFIPNGFFRPMFHNHYSMSLYKQAVDFKMSSLSRCWTIRLTHEFDCTYTNLLIPNNNVFYFTFTIDRFQFIWIRFTLLSHQSSNKRKIQVI